MGDKAIKLLAFVVGAIVGSVATYVAVKGKLENDMRVEVEAVKDEYFDKARDLDKLKKHMQNVCDESTKEDTDRSDSDDKERPNVSDVIEYHNIASNYKPTDAVYISDEGGIKVVDRKEGDDLETPYAITYEEFGELDYTCISLTHYADGVLADSITDEVIEDMADVGADYAEHFGEHEEDTVYIRNDFLQMDFEICRDYRRYKDVVGTHEYEEE